MTTIKELIKGAVESIEGILSIVIYDTRNTVVFTTDRNGTNVLAENVRNSVFYLICQQVEKLTPLSKVVYAIISQENKIIGQWRKGELILCIQVTSLVSHATLRNLGDKLMILIEPLVNAIGNEVGNKLDDDHERSTKINRNDSEEVAV